ncbi:MAG: rhomboid family intramembrane serine protease [Candidatus Acidiferrales bacterium]
MEAKPEPSDAPQLQWRVPWLTLLLAALLAATYAWQVAADHSSPKHPFDSVLLALGMKGEAVFAGQWWRLLSAIFVHIDLHHIAVNLCFLLLFGCIAETIFPRASYLALWFLAGIAGSLSQLAALSPRAYGYGSSGVAFGLVGALWSAYSLHRVGSPSTVRRWSVAILLGIFIILGFMPDWIHSHYINSAHLGGLLAGMFLGLALPTRITPAPVKRLCATIAITAMLFAGCARFAHQKQDFLLQLFAIESAHPDLQQLPDFPPSAAAKLQDAVIRHPDLLAARLMLARMYAKEGRTEEAIHQYSAVLAARPEQADVWDEAANVALNAHRYPEAIVGFTRYIELRPARPGAAGPSATNAEILQTLASLAQAYELGGHADQAIAVNRRILQLDPQNGTAQDNLSRLLKLSVHVKPHP